MDPFLGAIMVLNSVWLHTCSNSDTDMIVMMMVFKWITAHWPPAGMSARECDWLNTNDNWPRPIWVESTEDFREQICGNKNVGFFFFLRKKSLSIWSVIEWLFGMSKTKLKVHSKPVVVSIIWLVTNKVPLCGCLLALLTFGVLSWLFPLFWNHPPLSSICVVVSWYLAEGTPWIICSHGFVDQKRICLHVTSARQKVALKSTQ